IDVLSTEEMYEMVLEHFKDTDILIKSAAPSDYKVKKYSENKIKKASETLNIELVKNPDILKKCGEIKTNQQLIGFAAESQNLEDNAIAKLKKKNLDMIIANNILDENAGFKSDKNKVTLFKKDGFKKEYPLMTKENLANIILDNI
ncbi:MAG: phosphopantothenoylcysteine decarboxylase domain-containing protein, partial [Senegalia sp. (in: firmicutes)]